jgi:ribosomal protein S27AE
VVRPCLEAFDDDAGVADMLDDANQAHFVERHEKEMEESAKELYKMLDSAQKPLHEQTMISQLDAIGRVMGLKVELNLSREGFDKMLAVFGTMLPEKHTLPTNLYEAEKLLRMLKMSYDKIHVCPKGCVLFMKEHKDANFCPKCKSSRYLEVDSGDGQKKQLLIPARVLQHLPFMPRIQQLFMTEESAKHMTWHKDGKRYNPGKMVHLSNAEVWTYFNDKHRDKGAKARNVRVVLATDGFNPYGMMAAPYTC